MKTLKSILKSRFAGILLIFIGHLILLNILAETNIVGSLFAAGAHVPRLNIITAIIFICFRLLALIYLPGLLLGWAGKLLIEKYTRNSTFH